jgi:hypothetical protein
MKNFGVTPENWKAVTLGSELRIDIKNSVVYEHIEEQGIPGDMLVPLVESKRYADQHGDEGVAFWNRHWAIKSFVCDHAYPINTLKMSVYDGNNVVPIEKFMVDHATPEHEGRWQLGLAEMEHMRAVLLGFGVQAEARQPSAPALPVG